MAVKTDKGIKAGSSWFGDLIITTYPKLIEILGQPTFNDNTGEDKVNMEWVCESREGFVFTIYDWKEYEPLNEEYEYGFHIGGFSEKQTKIAKAELELMIDVITPDFY
jgi:hypothetical protein